MCKPGHYCVVVTNNVGCETTLCADICYCYPDFHEPNEDPTLQEGICTQNNDGIPQSFSISYDASDATSEDSNDGAIDLDVQGGLPDLYYEWTGPNDFIAAVEDIDNLPPGEYCVKVTDGCFTKNQCITIETCEGSDLTISGSATKTCDGYSYGSIQISINGGTPPYNINWDNGTTSSTLDNLSKGTYCVIVRDNGNCNVGERCFKVELMDFETSREGCTTSKYCGNNFISSTTLATYQQYNAQDCRFLDTYCSDGVPAGLPVWIGSVFETNGGASCIVTERCYNGQYFDTHYGTTFSAITSDCFYVEGCSFGELGSYLYYIEDRLTLSGVEVGIFPDLFCKVEVICNGQVINDFLLDGACPPLSSLGRPIKSLNNILANEIIERESSVELNKFYTTENIDPIINIKDTEAIQTIVGNELNEYSNRVAEKIKDMNKSTEEVSNTEYFVYPNPFKDIITIDLSKTQKAKNSNIKVVLRNILGEEVFKQNYLDISTHIKLVGMANLPDGVYLLEIQSEDNYKEIIKLLKTNF
ncbi:MAG: T9SS type A sorting domain-containing protein [Chitinophagales bacterium]